MAKFKVGGKEYETKPMRGRGGRATTNYMLKAVSRGEIDDLIDLTTDNKFLVQHLPHIVGDVEAKEIDENANTTELLNMINAIVNEMGEGFESEEVSAALKNSEDTPEEEE